MAGSKQLELWLVSGPDAPRALAVPAGPGLVIGRDPGCGLVLADARVSGRHARVLADGAGLAIEDLRSANGTRVNGAEVTRRTLAGGDGIEIGTTRLEVRGGAAAAPAPPRTELGGPDRALLDALGVLLTGSAEEAGISERMLDGLIAAFGADRGAVFAPTGRGYKVLSQRVRPGAEVEADDPPISRSLLGRVIEDGRPMLLTSAETEELRQEIKSISGGLRSIMAVPLALEQGRAVVYLDSALERYRFREADRELLLVFARAAGDAMAKDREHRELARRQERLGELQRRELAAEEIVGDSGPMRAVLAEVGRAAGSDVTVLVTGESGTGKELVARALHKGSGRAARSFVAVNCAAIPAELVESELFGHEKGAFTGAEARRLGHFELADGGTLFLDEIGELPLPVQGKLLRALQERTVVRVGGSQPVKVDFRLVCATHVELAGAVKGGRFREDLFYRIAVFRIGLPPLRERGSDVLELAEAFLARFACDLRRPVRGMDDEVKQALLAHPWPGNIRELRNVIEQAVVREDGETLRARSVLPALGLVPGLPADPAAPAGALFAGPFDAARKAFEREYLLHHLGVQKGNMKATAEAIGLSRKALYLKCDEYGIDYGKYR